MSADRPSAPLARDADEPRTLTPEREAEIREWVAEVRDSGAHFRSWRMLPELLDELDRQRAEAATERARRKFLSYQSRFLGWGITPDMRTPCVNVYVEGEGPYSEVQAASVKHDGTRAGSDAAEDAAIDHAMLFVAARASEAP